MSSCRPVCTEPLTACLRRDELSSVAAMEVVETDEHALADLVPVDAAHAPEAEPARPWPAVRREHTG